LAAGFLAAGFFAVVLAAGFLAAGFFAAGFFAAGFFAAGFFAVVLAAGFFAAGFLAVVFLVVDVVIFLMAIISLRRVGHCISGLGPNLIGGLSSQFGRLRAQTRASVLFEPPPSCGIQKTIEVVAQLTGPSAAHTLDIVEISDGCMQQALQTTKLADE